MTEYVRRGRLAEWLANEIDLSYQRYLTDLARRLREVVPDMLAREEVLADVRRWQAEKREKAIARFAELDAE
jgi:hypothetical protein